MEHFTEDFAEFGGSGGQDEAPDRRSLTHYEIEGLNGHLSLADGHASHDPQTALAALISAQGTLWYEGLSLRPSEITSRLIHVWAKLAGEPGAPCTSCCISPTASNNIGIAAAALKARNKRTWLITPTFDNISLLARRHSVDLHPVQETRLHLDPVGFIRTLGAEDALFLVDPNNPTGTSLESETLDSILTECAQRGVAIVIDRTFRVYGAKAEKDLIGRLTRAGVSFVLIEDTGKTWPTQDRKVSQMFYSNDWLDSLKIIYEEIYLCPSGADVFFFAKLFELERALGFPESLHKLVRGRRDRLREVLGGTRLRIAPESETSQLPVEWIDISATGMADSDLIRRVASGAGVHLLPGRQFYWDRHSDAPTDRIRASLLKPQKVFDESMERLAPFLRKGF